MAYRAFRSAPAAATPADLYTVPASKEAVVSTLSVANFGPAATTWQAWLRPDGSAASNAMLLAGTAVVINSQDAGFLTIGIVMEATDVLTVQSASGSVAFQAFVSETDV